MDLRDLDCGHPNYLFSSYSPSPFSSSPFLFILPLLLVRPFSSASYYAFKLRSLMLFFFHSSYILFPQSLFFYNLHLVHDSTMWHAYHINSTTNAANLFSSVFIIVMASPPSCINISYALYCKYPVKCILLNKISTLFYFYLFIYIFFATVVFNNVEELNDMPVPTLYGTG
jgi:hypothetical protein